MRRFSSPSDTEAETKTARVLIGWFAVAGGAVTLCGWFANLPRLADWVGDGIFMMPNAAACSTAVGLAILALAGCAPAALVRAGGALAAAIGAATLIEHLSGLNLHLDTALVVRSWGQFGTVAPGRMGPPASTAWMVLGLATVLAVRGSNGRRAAVVGATFSLLLALLSLVGRVFGAEPLYTIPRLTIIAVPTAIIVFFLSVALLVTLHDRQPMKTLFSSSTAGLLGRRTLPVILILPVLLGWLRLLGQRAGLFDTASGTAMRTLVEFVLLAALLWWTLAVVSAKERALQLEIEARKRSDADRNFLAATSEELVRLETVEAIMTRVGARIGEHFALAFCNFAEVRETEGTLVVTHDWHRDSVPSSVGEYRQSSYLTAEFERTLRSGQPFVVANTATDPRTDAAKYAALRMGAFVSIPIVQDGQWKFFVNCIDSGPRQWGAEELQLLRELTMRIWTRLERVRAERQLRASEARLRESEGQFRALANAMPQLAWIAHADGYIDWYNDRWYSYTGTTPAQMAGWGWQSVHEPATLPRVMEAWRTSIATGEPFEMTFPLRGADGQFRSFLTRVVPIKDAAQQVIQWFGTNTDVDRLEGLVAERTARLREMNEELEAFSYSMAHDLRGPLRAMQGFAEVLMEDYGGQLDDQARRHLTRISGSAERMQRLLLDVLGYSRINRGDFPLGPVALGPLLETIIEEYPSLGRAGIQIAEPLAAVHGNPAALTQVLSNLLTNAAKFIPADRTPRIDVSSRLDGDTVEISVQDNGIGIAPEHRDRIFGMFERVHPAAQYDGTGIGLAVVRRAVERMAGKVGVEPAPDGGSRFWIRLRPAESSAAAS